MSNVWDTFSEFWATWGPFISLSLIPTIIVGLSVDPRTAPARNAFERVWNVIKQILDLLSVAKPKNRPGTFQLPLKLDTVVDTVAKKSGPILVVIIALASYGLHGCAWLKSTGETAKVVAIDCSVASIQDNARMLVPALIGILTGGAGNWKEQVKLFVKEFGRDATACALQAALQRLNDPIASEAVEDPETVRIESAKRANQFIGEQSWNFSN